MTKGYEGMSSDLDVEGLLEELWELVNTWMIFGWTSRSAPQAETKAPMPSEPHAPCRNAPVDDHIL